MDDPKHLYELLLNKRLPIEILFDTGSLRSEVIGGQSRSITRHLLFKASSLCLDLRLERPTSSSSTRLSGQLAASNNPMKPVVDIPILLVVDQEITAHTASDRNGEFLLTLEGTRTTRLLLPVGTSQLLEIPVTEVAKGADLEKVGSDLL